MAFDPDLYRRWRAQFPFTDEMFALEHELIASQWERDGNQFKAAVHRKSAARCRLGRVGKIDLYQCLGALIKSCGICGKKALYRLGSVGRCSEHRLVPHAPVETRRRRLEARETAMQEEAIQRDRSLHRKQLRFRLRRGAREKTA